MTKMTAAAAAQRPDGSFQLARLGGLVIFVHWSFLGSGWLAILFAAVLARGRLSPLVYPGIAMGTMIIIFAHEFGHALAARIFGLKAYAIHLKGLGGICYAERPRRLHQALLFCSANVLVQLVILVCTVVVLQQPKTNFGGLTTGLIVAFTLVNVFMAFTNLIPFTTPSGTDSDGRKLARLVHDALRGRTFTSLSIPGMKTLQAAPLFPPETSLLSVKALVPMHFVHGIEILSDPVTHLNFVVATFVKHLGWDHSVALTRAIEIHNRGGMLWPLSSREEAEQVASAIMTDAAEANFPLVCRAVTKAV